MEPEEITDEELADIKHLFDSLYAKVLSEENRLDRETLETIHPHIYLNGGMPLKTIHKKFGGERSTDEVEGLLEVMMEWGLAFQEDDGKYIGCFPNAWFLEQCGESPCDLSYIA